MVEMDQEFFGGLAYFARGDVPLTAVLLIDSSVSMKGERLASGLQGAEAFVASMRPLDEAMLMRTSHPNA